MPLLPRLAIPAPRLALAAALVLPLSGCGGVPDNASLYSVHQPVVSHASTSLDLVATSGDLAPSEVDRLAAWFAAMHLRYGDQISIIDPLASQSARASVADAAARFGVVLGEPYPAPTSGPDGGPMAGVAPGTLRVTLVRASAHVPHCPDWSGNSASNPRSATSTNFGCAINSNLAAMIANPDQLLKGATTSGDTAAMSAAKAIVTWRNDAPSPTAAAKDTPTH